MPLYLRAPKEGRSPHYHLRGKHLGIKVEESTGTGVKALAKQLLKAKEQEIERGAVARPGEATFGDAVDNYINAGGESRFFYRAKPDGTEEATRLLMHFAEKPIRTINLPAIDEAAGKLYPNATTATRNRQVYTPVSAVLKRAGIEFKVKRPKGWRGRRRTFWLRPEQAQAIFEACNKLKTRTSKTRIEFRIFLRLLCYTGMRLSDALGLQCQSVDLDAGTALIPKTKNSNPRTVHLPPVVVEELRHVPQPIKGRVGRVFSLTAGSRLRDRFAEVCKIAGVAIPTTERVKFHVFCHTWGTWMRLYGGLTREDLLETDRWADAESVEVYDHMVVSDIAKKADLLPGANKEAA